MTFETHWVAAAAQHWALVEAAVAVLDTARALVVAAARALVVAAVAVLDTARALVEAAARALVVAAVAVLDTARALVEAAVATAVAAAAIAALVVRRGTLHSFAFVPQSHEMDQMAKPMEAQAS